jgi:hypothetical protein
MPSYEIGPGDDSSGLDEAMGAEDNVLGAAPRQMMRPQRRGMVQRAQQGGYRTPQGAPIYPRPPLPHGSFQPNVSRLRSFMGVGVASWSSGDAGDKVLQVTPQESFRGERLIIDVSTINGPSAGLVLLRRVDIGTLPQSPSVEQPAPAAMFAANATYSRIDLQIAYRATIIQVTLGITAAPGGTAAVTAAVGFFGEWIR